MRSTSTRRVSSSSDPRTPVGPGRGRGRVALPAPTHARPRSRATHHGLRGDVPWIALLAATVTGACDTGVLRPQREALDAARVQWAVANVTSYTFEVQRHCFCLDRYVRPMWIQVVDGVVVSAVYADDGTHLPDEIEPPTVAGLFDEIQAAIDQDAHSVEASYHVDLGYPTDVSIDFIERAVDEEMAFQIHALDPGTDRAPRTDHTPDTPPAARRSSVR